MLILRGKAGKYALPGEQPRDWPRGALDEPPALEFARLRGYDAKVLDVIGYSGAGGQQVRMALAEIRADDDVFALYGFSAGGYAIYNIIRALTRKEKERLRHYGQQVLAPIFSQLDVLAARYTAQRADLEQIAGQITVLRRAIGE